MEFLYIFSILFLLIFGAVMLMKTVLSALLGSKPQGKGEDNKGQKNKGA